VARDDDVVRRLDGRHVIVTGANIGIRAAVAERLAGDGAAQTFLARDAERLERVAEPLDARTAVVDIRARDRVVAAELGGTPEEAHDVAMAAVPLGRMARPDEIAGTVAWLLSDDAVGVTGAGDRPRRRRLDALAAVGSARA
jgi:NAD(P)-dependent dehydrogenase (short-subunit alcohol dehydrogenase family)